VRTTCARIVQEGLTNALKHAGPGAAARVAVGVDAAGVVIDVTDTGSPSAGPALPASGHGLSGLRERVALLGGAVTAGPAEPTGWRLHAWLPHGGDA
jgi:signal transduction histidine kinase